jgi:hypothetical protein
VSGSGSTLPLSAFNYCPGSATTFHNLMIKTSNLADNGTLMCAAIFWQFERPGQYVEWRPTVAATTQATLRVRYTNGYGLPATTSVTSASGTQTISWASTGTWQNWQSRTIAITIGVGTVVRLEWSGPAGSPDSGGIANASSLNIDEVQITVP